MKELVGHERNPALYTILFDQNKIIIEKFFEQTGQVVVNDTNTRFIEHITFIMKNVLEAGNKEEQAETGQLGQNRHQAENLGQTSIELMMLAIVRYVRHLDTTVHALHIKTRLCQLIEAMMRRRDDLAFRQEMRFRNRLNDCGEARGTVGAYQEGK